MKNLLSFDLSLKIERKGFTKNDIVRFLKEELQDVFWDSVVMQNDESDFTYALRIRDYEKMYQIVREPLCSPKRRIVNVLKKIGRRVLRFIK